MKTSAMMNFQVYLAWPVEIGSSMVPKVLMRDPFAAFMTRRLDTGALRCTWLLGNSDLEAPVSTR